MINGRTANLANVCTTPRLSQRFAIQEQSFMSCSKHARRVALAAVFACACRASGQQVTAFTNGRWFDGSTFVTRTGYSVGDRLTFQRPAHVDREVDLAGAFVIPPFGDAHAHTVEPSNNIDSLVRSYLSRG